MQTASLLVVGPSIDEAPPIRGGLRSSYRCASRMRALAVDESVALACLFRDH